MSFRSQEDFFKIRTRALVQRSTWESNRKRQTEMAFMEMALYLWLRPMR